MPWQSLTPYNAEEIVAIGAAAFRSAGNGEEFAKEIQDATGVKVHIVDQTLEGKLAFQAVLSKMDVDPEHLVVWDIGGGSGWFACRRLQCGRIWSFQGLYC